MYIYLILVPCLNYFDSKINFLPLKNISSIVVVVLYLSTALLTAYLAIKHFVNASKRRMEYGR
jgi:hypothetical protein